MSLDPQIIGPLCGAVSSMCGLAALAIREWRKDRHEQRIMDATPEQLAALQGKPARLPGAASAAMLLLGAGLSIGYPVASGRAHPMVTIQRILDSDDERAQSAQSCTKDEDCPRGQTCIAKICTVRAAKPPPRLNAQAQPFSGIGLADSRPAGLPVNMPGGGS